MEFSIKGGCVILFNKTFKCYYFFRALEDDNVGVDVAVDSEDSAPLQGMCTTFLVELSHSILFFMH